MLIHLEEKYANVLAKLAESLDIPPSKYQQAVQRYQSIGKWLEEGHYEGSIDGVIIFPQGSFQLGTVVKPLAENKNAGYDIDLVCQLSVPKEKTSAAAVKDAVGTRLADNDTYKGMLDDEGKRCWTIEYAEEDGAGFHIDVLPSVAEDSQTIGRLQGASEVPDLVYSAIAITDKNGDDAYEWDTSNPYGYAQWFKDINAQSFGDVVVAKRTAIAQKHPDLFASIDDVPDQLIRTPLQQAIQIMKRHRDLRFSGQSNEDFKPISMIITTLAARLYNNEDNVYLALQNIVSQLRNGGDDLSHEGVIEKRSDGTWYIPNPVNNDENFADRWHEDGGARADAFFQWVSWVSDDLVELVNSNDFDDAVVHLEEQFDAELSESGTPIKSPAIITGVKEELHVEIEDPSKPWHDRQIDYMTVLRKMLNS